MDKLLCHICRNIFSYIEMLNRHLGNHQSNTLNCPNCKYTSPRKDALKRHAKKHIRTDCRSLTANNYHQTQTKGSKSRIETKAYQADSDSVNSYIYQQSLPKNKEVFHGYYMNWIHNQEIQDHITYQNLLSSLKTLMKHYLIQENGINQQNQPVSQVR